MANKMRGQEVLDKMKKGEYKESVDREGRGKFRSAHVEKNDDGTFSLRAEHEVSKKEESKGGDTSGGISMGPATKTSTSTHPDKGAMLNYLSDCVDDGGSK
jgi:hypothetical protein